MPLAMQESDCSMWPARETPPIPFPIPFKSTPHPPILTWQDLGSDLPAFRLM